MTPAEWLEQALDGAPPLTPPQLAALRPACQRMAARMGNAAPAVEREPRTSTEPERNSA